MKKIYKYRLEYLETPQIVFMPKDATVRHVGQQEGFVVIWVELDPHQTSEERTFLVAGTGYPIPDNSRYCGTASINPFVWHVYETHG